jgi:hypothetical protein
MITVIGFHQIRPDFRQIRELIPRPKKGNPTWMKIAEKQQQARKLILRIKPFSCPWVGSSFSPLLVFQQNDSFLLAL